MMDFIKNEIIHYLSNKKKKIALELLNYGIIKSHTQPNSTHSDGHYTLLAIMLQLGFLIYVRDRRGTHFFHIKFIISVSRVEIPFLAKKTQNKLLTSSIQNVSDRSMISN